MCVCARCTPVSGKTVVAKFDGGLLSSDGGILVLREVEQRLRVADRLAACIKDPRSPDQITHSLADIIRFRLLMIAAGYEDGNDASNLRGDFMFKMALDLSPSDRELQLFLNAPVKAHRRYLGGLNEYPLSNPLLKFKFGHHPQAMAVAPGVSA